MTKTEAGLWLMAIGILGATFSAVLGVYARFVLVRAVFLALAAVFVVMAYVAHSSLPVWVR